MKMIYGDYFIGWMRARASKNFVHPQALVIALWPHNHLIRFCNCKFKKLFKGKKYHFNIAFNSLKKFL